MGRNLVNRGVPRLRGRRDAGCAGTAAQRVGRLVDLDTEGRGSVLLGITADRLLRLVRLYVHASRLSNPAAGLRSGAVPGNGQDRHSGDSRAVLAAARRVRLGDPLPRPTTRNDPRVATARADS